MKDLPGNLALGSKTAWPRSTRKESKFWTLMVIGGSGSIFSFRVGKPLVVTLTCFVLMFLAFTVVAVIFYRAVSTENEMLKKDLDKVRSNLLAISKARDRALVRLMAFEGEAEPALQVSPVQPGKTGETEKPVVLENLSIEQLEIWKEIESSSVNFQFMLKNIDPQGRKVRGHTFVVLSPEEGAQEALKVFPWTPLKDGRPAIFRKGQFFSIARIKSIRGTFPDIETTECFKAATIYVFSETGSLLLEKVYELAEILRS